MDYLPLFFDFTGKSVLVVGGGEVATRKAELLHRASAVITVVAPAIKPRLIDLARLSKGLSVLRDYQLGDIKEQSLVVVATNNNKLNLSVSEQAKALGIPVNVVDQPALCDVIFPAIVDRSPIQVAISSSAAAPVLARKIRTNIESSLAGNLGTLADFISARRPEVNRVLGQDRVRQFWEDIVESEVAECVLSGRTEHAESLYQQKLSIASTNAKQQGEVYLIGAGPGDPDLMTFKAMRLLQRADVVLYDRLVSPDIVDMSRRDAEKRYVGKEKSNHALPQSEINQLLISLALSGKKVARLKGGDPFVFGRGGEEIEGLAENNIPFQVVPGISAANGCACYAGIPLTHRDHAQSVRFVTGHLKDGAMDLPWDQLAKARETLVIYMGLTGLSHIVERLTAHGLPAQTPVALIERGTTPQQKCYVSTLDSIEAQIARHDVHAPTLIIIGSVVTLRQQLGWDDSGLN